MSFLRSHRIWDMPSAAIIVDVIGNLARVPIWGVIKIIVSQKEDLLSLTEFLFRKA